MKILHTKQFDIITDADREKLSRLMMCVGATLFDGQLIYIIAIRVIGAYGNKAMRATIEYEVLDDH